MTHSMYAQTLSSTSNDSLTYDEILQQAQNIDMSNWQVFANNLKVCSMSTIDLPNPSQIKAFISVAANMGDVTQNINQVPASFTQDTFDQMLASASIHAEILGWQDKSCQVRLSLAYGPIDNIPHSNRLIIKDCLIPRDSIPFILNKINQLTGEGMSTPFLNIDPLSNIISSSCK